jgi:hypothetical protein
MSLYTVSKVIRASGGPEALITFETVYRLIEHGPDIKAAPGLAGGCSQPPDR